MGMGSGKPYCYFEVSNYGCVLWSESRGYISTVPSITSWVAAIRGSRSSKTISKQGVEQGVASLLMTIAFDDPGRRCGVALPV